MLISTAIGSAAPFASLIFLNQAGQIRAAHVLNSNSLPQLTQTLGPSISSVIVAPLSRDDGGVVLAFANSGAAYPEFGPATTGAVLLVKLQHSAELSLLNGDGTAAAVLGSAPCDVPSAAAVAVVSQNCHAACGAGCTGPLSSDCNARVCAAGFVASTDGRGACCPDVGVPMYYIGLDDEHGSVNDTCGICHESCRACDGPDQASCLPSGCVDGFWWNGMECVPLSPECDAAAEYELTARPDADRVCAPCNAACIPGAGCSGPLASQCGAVAVVTSGTAMYFLLPEVDGVAIPTPQSSRLAAHLPTTIPVVDLALISPNSSATATTGGGLTAFALTVSGSVWAADVDVAVAVGGGGPAPVAEIIGSAGGPSIGLYASRDEILVLREDGSVVSILDGAEILRAPPTSLSLVGVHALRRELVVGTEDGQVLLTTGDETTVVARGLDSAVVSVDYDNGMIVWRSENGVIGATGGTWSAEEHREADVGWYSGSGGVAVVAESSTAVSAFALSAPVPGNAAAEVRVDSTPLQELGVSTQGEGDGMWAPEGTLGGAGNNRFGGDGNGIAHLDDVDGDALADVAIGAPSQPAGGAAFHGVVFVARLLADGRARLLQTISRDAGIDAGVTFPSGLQWFGAAIAGMSDWDGDGVPELAVGAPRAEFNRGGVVLMKLTRSGSCRALVWLNDAAISAGTLSNDDYFGNALATLPDADGDGRQELVVGAPLDNTAANNAGAVYVLFLHGDDMAYSRHVKLLTTLSDPVSNMYIGCSVAAAPWVSTHGRNHSSTLLAVGAKFDADGGGTGTGAVYLVLLTSDASDVSWHLKLSAAGPNLEEVGVSLSDNDLFGGGVAMSDVNADGVPDLFVARPRATEGAGKVLLLSLRENVGGVPELAGSLELAPSGPSAGRGIAVLGYAASILAIGAPQMSSWESPPAGVVDLYPIHLAPPLRFEQDVVELSMTTQGSDAASWAPADSISTARIGSEPNSIATIQDIDGDGATDLLIGEHSIGESGAVLVLAMRDNGVPRLLRVVDGPEDIAPGATAQFCASPGSNFGSAVTGVDHVDAAKPRRVVVGAPRADADAGALYLLGLRPSSALVDHCTVFDRQVLPVGAGDLLGYGLAQIADLDGDGRNEVVAGAYRSGSGVAFVLFIDDNNATLRRFEHFAGSAPAFGYSIAWLAAQQTLVVSASEYSAATNDALTSGEVALMTLNDDGSPATTRRLNADGGLEALPTPLTSLNYWGSGVAALPDLDGNGVAELLVTGFRVGDETRADVLFLDMNGEVTAAVELGNPLRSAMPAAAIQSGVGGLCALPMRNDNGVWLVVGAVTNGAAVVSIAPAGQLVETRFLPTVISQSRAAALPVAAPARSSAIAAISRRCSLSCAGGCVAGATARDCDASTGCTEGHSASLRGTGVVSCSGNSTDTSEGRSAVITPVLVGGRGRTLSWSTDGRGYPAAFIGGVGGASIIAIADGGNTTVAGFDDADDVVASAFADVDTDGLADLLVLRHRGYSGLFMAHTDTEGVLQFVNQSEVRGFGFSVRALAVAVGDCDGDRDVDVYVATAAGQRNRLYVNDGEGYFALAADSGEDMAQDGAPSVALFDFDEDGDLDLLMQRTSGAGPVLLVNDGACCFREDASPTSSVLRVSELQGALVSSIVLADANRDGHIDALATWRDGKMAMVEFLPAARVTAFAPPGNHSANRVLQSAVSTGIDADKHDHVLLATSRGLAMASAHSAELGDVATALLNEGQPVGVVPVAAPVPGDTSILSVVDNVGVFQISRVETQEEAGVLVVRVEHRLRGPLATAFGSVVRVFAEDVLQAPARIVDGGGRAAQLQPQVLFRGLDPSRAVDIEVSFSTSYGASTFSLEDVAVSELARTVVDAFDTIAVPSVSTTQTSGCVGIGDSLSLLISAGAETSLTLSPVARFNGKAISTDDFRELGNGMYELVVTVEEGDRPWMADTLPLQLVLRDPAWGVDSGVATWPEGRAAVCGDGVRPVAEFDRSPPEFTGETSAEFLLTCSELACRYEYNVDSEGWTAVDATSDGEDGRNNVDDVLLREPPVVALQEYPPRLSNRSTASFSVAVFGASLEQLEYRLDDFQRWQSTGGRQSVTFPSLADGVHIVRFRAGVADASPAIYVWKVDTTPPTVSVSVAPSAAHSPSSSMVAVVTASEEGCRYSYRVVAPDGSLEMSAVTRDNVLAIDVGEMGAAYHFLVTATDAAGWQSGAVNVDFLVPACPEVPDVTLVSAVPSGDGGYVMIVESTSDFLEVRHIDGNMTGSWRVTSARIVHAPLTAAAQTAPNMLHAVEVRAFAECVTVPRERPEPKRVEWSEPPALPPLRAEIERGPNSVTTLTTAVFALSTTHGRGAAPLECAYAVAAVGTSDSLRFVGGASNGSDPLWRPCTPDYVLEPLPIARHRLLVRIAVSGDSAIVSHDWTVTAASASAFSVTGRDSGTHDVIIRATDAANNVQLSNFSVFEWEVDRDAPETAASVSGGEFISANEVHVVAECQGEQDVDHCEFVWQTTQGPVVDGQGAAEAEGTVVIEIPAGVEYDAPYSVEFAAKDRAGNVDPTPQPLQWVIDRVDPVINVTIINGTLFQRVWYVSSDRPAVLVMSDEPLSEVRINDASRSVEPSAALQYEVPVVESSSLVDGYRVRSRAATVVAALFQCQSLLSLTPMPCCDRTHCGLLD